MTSDETRYHAANEDEMTHLAEAISALNDWRALAGFARAYYGARATNITVLELGDFNDETWGYDSDGEDQPFDVRDEADVALSPDLTAPAWQEWIDQKVAGFDQVQARCAEHGWRLTERDPRGLREETWVEDEWLRSLVNDELCDLRFRLPHRELRIDLRRAPPSFAGRVYVPDGTLDGALDGER